MVAPSLLPYGIFVHLSTVVLAVMTFVLTRYLDAKPIGRHTVIDSVMRDMFVSSMIRQVGADVGSLTGLLIG